MLKSFCLIAVKEPKVKFPWTSYRFEKCLNAIQESSHPTSRAFRLLARFWRSREFLAYLSKWRPKLRGGLFLMTMFFSPKRNRITFPVLRIVKLTFSKRKLQRIRPSDKVFKEINYWVCHCLIAETIFSESTAQ